MAREKARYSRLVAQIQILARGRNQVVIAPLLQAANNRGADQAAVARDKNPAGWGHERTVYGFLFLHAYAPPRGATLCPARSSVRSCCASSRSCSTMERTNSSKPISGSHPRTSRALLASPCSESTSV